MPSYVVTGSSRGLGVRIYFSLAVKIYLNSLPQLGFVRTLSAEPTNLVFALIRSHSSAEQLHEFISGHPHKNVHVIEADCADSHALQVYISRSSSTYSAHRTIYRKQRTRLRRLQVERWMS
jgi:hypothetical protein